MTALNTFFAMGGYAAYVWPAFAVTAVVLIGLLVVSLRRLHADERTLEVLRADRRKLREGEESAAPTVPEAEHGS